MRRCTLVAVVAFLSVGFTSAAQCVLSDTPCDGRTVLLGNGTGTCGVIPSACDDGLDCTTDTCSDTGLCTYSAANGTDADSCPTCALDGCTPSCGEMQCGYESTCGTSCGVCGAGKGCSKEHECIKPPSTGTCASPIHLGPVNSASSLNAVGDLSVYGLVNQFRPRCGWISGPEIVYSFTIRDGRSFYYDINVTSFADTMVSLLKGTCSSENEVMCNDDAPPVRGSRIVGLITAGNYFLVVDSYSSFTTGPFEISAKFSTCTPICDVAQRTCGDDGCGGSCGSCNSRQVCNNPGATLHFRPTLVPSECVNLTTICDPLHPACVGGCAKKEYCSQDCQCHSITSSKPVDFALLPNDTVESVHVQQIDAPTSCATSCVSGTGKRNVLRFSVATLNQGADFVYDRPLFQSEYLLPVSGWDACRNFWTLRNAYSYSLRSSTGSVVRASAKDMYCVRDHKRVLDGAVSCKAQKVACGGISHGWANVDDWSEECQWLDVTDLVAGSYFLLIEINPDRYVDESTYTNNRLCLRVAVPETTSFGADASALEDVEVVSCDSVPKPPQDHGETDNGGQISCAWAPFAQAAATCAVAAACAVVAMP
jgi:hypothetical protein